MGLALVATVLLGTLMAVAPPRAAPTVEGTVTSPDGAPVKGALVAVSVEMVLRGDTPATAFTDGEGRFRVPVESPGAYLVDVDARGFAPASRVRARAGVPLAVKLGKGRTLEGVVRDGATGKPVRDARVRVDAFAPFPSARPGAGRRETSTDARGAYRLEHLPDGALTVSGVARGYTSEGVPVSPAGTRADLTLRAGAWLTGTVKSASGARLEGAVVSATALAAHSRGGFGREETDAAGRFEILGLSPGMISVAACHPGFAPAFAPAVRASGATSIDLVLEEAATAVGRLVDEDGHPVAGSVLVDRLEGGSAWLVGDIPRGTTGPDGRFRLRDLPAGSHHATVSARGRAQRTIEVRTRRGAETDLGDVVLETGSAIRGRLRDAAGAPVAGARLFATSTEGGGFATTVVDAEGGFELLGLAEGRYRLSATVGDVQRASREVDAGGEAIEWTLESTGAIAGEVIDAAGRRVDGFRVVARPTGEADTGWSSPAATGAGTFRIDVPPGRYLLQVGASDHADAAVSDVVVSADRTTDVGRIRLGAAGGVRGTVVDADGNPVAGAAVTVRSQRNYAEGSIEGGPGVDTTAEGTFEIGGLNPGPIVVAASHPRLGSGQSAGLEVDPEAGPTEARVVLRPGGRVQGTIRRRGQGLKAIVSATAFSWSSRGSETALTEDDGSFSLENLPPGRVWIRFEPLGERDAQGVPARTAWVREGETTVVDVDLREILVAGRITRSGAAAPGLRVAFDREGERAGRGLEDRAGPQLGVAGTGPDGSYALLVGEPGSYAARVETADGALLHQRPVSVPDVEQLRFDIEFVSATVAGVLVDAATREPIAGGEVGAFREDTRDERRPVRTGPDGRFELQLEPGGYVLHARAPGRGSTQSAVEVGPQGVADLRMALPLGWSLRGRVVDARGQGVAAVPVLATGERKREAFAHADTAPDGSYELTGLAEDRYNLFAGTDLAGFAVARAVGQDTGEPQLVLRSPGRVRVAVEDASGAPVRGAVVVITAVDGAAVLGLPSFFAVTDAAGVVEVSVPTGTIELAVDDQRGHAGATVVEVRPDGVAEAAIAVSSGQGRD